MDEGLCNHAVFTTAHNDANRPQIDEGLLASNAITNLFLSHFFGQYKQDSFSGWSSFDWMDLSRYC
jgi:hypothetical protein